MQSAIQFHSRVDDDGLLNVQVNLGPAEANQEVVITIEPSGTRANNAASISWPEFLERTYGSCAGLDLERQDQGSYEQREPIQ